MGFEDTGSSSRRQRLPSAARMMRPKEAAEYLRRFSREEQIAEIKGMLASGGKTTNLGHGVAIILELDDLEEIDAEMKLSLKMSQEDLSVGYGGQVGQDAGQRSEFAGKGPMFAMMNERSDGDGGDND